VAEVSAGKKDCLLGAIKEIEAPVNVQKLFSHSSGLRSGVAGNSSSKPTLLKEKNPVHVCHVVSGDLWAGAACQVFNLLSELVTNDRIRLSAIVFNTGKLYKSLTSLKMPVLCLPEDTLSPLQIWWQVRRCIRNRKVDIMHCHGHKEHIIGCAAALSLRKRVKVIRTLHGMPEPYSGMAGFRARCSNALQEVCSLFLTDMIIVVSQDMKARVARRPWAGKSVCIHNGINPERIRTSVPSTVTRERLKFHGNEFLVGTACRLVPVKRLDILIQAFHALHRIFDHVTLIIAGDGPLMPELRRQADALGISDRVRFLGHCDDIYNIISIFDLFVMTSEHEGVPMALLEAISLGVPAVAPAAGGIPEVVKGHKVSLFPPLCIHDLIEIMSGAVKNRNGWVPHEQITKNNVRSISAKQTSIETARVYEAIQRFSGT
jgi:glycosyltransferase involved in cell wall biosynthesis